MSEFNDLIKQFDTDSKKKPIETPKPTILIIDDDESIPRGLSRVQ